MPAARVGRAPLRLTVVAFASATGRRDTSRAAGSVGAAESAERWCFDAFSAGAAGRGMGRAGRVDGAGISALSCARIATRRIPGA